MTPKQQRFVAEYLIDLNAKQAAIRCGYSANSAEVQGSRLLRNAQVKAAVAQGTAEQLETAKLTAAGTLEAIRRQVHGDIRRLFDEAGNLKPIAKLTEEEAALITGFEVVIKNAQAGDGHTDTVHKVKLSDRGRYVEMAAKHFALLTERVEVGGSDALIAALNAGRQRARELRKC